jgi:ABC-2 type transport system permease protein
MNVVGMKSLLNKEIRRFLRVPGQTLASPLVSTTLYFLVFGYTLAGRVEGGQDYIGFIVPGLVFMGLSGNAFANSSSSFFIAKLQGTVVDLLVAPLGPLELLFGFITGAMVRGLLVAMLTWAIGFFFWRHAPANLAWTAVFLILSSYVFALLGLLAAMWAEKFEQVNIFPTFFMLPLTFLGGIFYSVHRLPEPFRTLSLFNPVVYMVDGLRAGMLGTSDGSPVLGVVILVLVASVGTALAYTLLARGYKLKS